MTLFSISQLSQFSGIKPHTIRIWEQRYNALTPLRSEGNTRYYDSSQLRRLLNIVSLLDSEYKVSELCSMSDEKLFRLVRLNMDKYRAEGPEEYFISQLIAAGMDYDEVHFEKIFSHCLLRYGLLKVYRKIIYPTLVRMGILWTGNVIPPGQEHFMCNIFRQKLNMAIDALPPAYPAEDDWVLFLPENELHEIGLLFSHYLIRLGEKRVVYLGANVPLASVAAAVKDTGASNLLLFLVHYDLPENVDNYLEELRTEVGDKKIFVAGNTKILNELQESKNLQLMRSVEDLGERIKLNDN